MTPADYQRAGELFEQLRELPEGERAPALDAACGGNAGLREQVMQLLEADSDNGADRFLERPALEEAARLVPLNPSQHLPNGPLPGTRFGPYGISGLLGEGGMGEVYRAHDSRLNRDVAIKVLRAELASDSQFMARFEREAQLLASLNHPNIATIYGLEDRGLIMELVEGPTLAERIAQGPIVWEEAAQIAIQIADALEAAHEKGVVHRDLKPANVKVTPEGRVKVLDFGLAKPLSKEPLMGGSGSSPTQILASTVPGIILGTAAYMAPEQAKGKVVDWRADIWAFGVVCHEMLTGRNLFMGETVADTLAAVLKAEPDLGSLPAPARPIVDRCLRRDPRKRWQAIGDARIAIEEALTGRMPDPPQTLPKTRALQRLGWAALGAVSAAAAVALLYLILRQENLMPPPVLFTVDTPGNGSVPLGAALRVSPNGESIVFLAVDPVDNISHLYLHSLVTGASRALPGTERATDAYWSFDSLSLLLNRGGGLSKIDINGNSPQPLPLESGYSSWGPGGVVTATREGLRWFHPDTGGSRLITTTAAKPGDVSIYPTLIPGGRWIVYNSYSGALADGVSVQIASVNGREQRALFTAERTALYAGPGYMLYLRGATLTARGIDPASGKMRGDPMSVIGPVEHALGSVDPGIFSASNNGVLAFRRASGSAESHLVWFDRSGKREGIAGGVADYSNPALSPDDKRLAVGIRDPGTGTRDIWILDLLRGAATRLTFDPSDHSNPVWSPDGARVAYTCDRRGARDLYVKNASGIGEDELLLQSPLPKNVEDWSDDGRWIVYNEAVPNNGDDLVVLPLDSRKPQDFLRTRFLEDKGRFSPDGHWLAYQSDETGRAEVCIQPFPPSGEKWQISTGGGGAPQWRGDGKELYYSTLQDPSRIMAVDIRVKDKAIDAGIPHLLFEVGLTALGPRNRWVVTRDGKKFLAVVPTDPKPVHSFTVIVNWPSLLHKR